MTTRHGRRCLRPGAQIVPGSVSALAVWLRFSRRESIWKDGEILVLRHQLAVAVLEGPRMGRKLAWADRAWLSLVAGVVLWERMASLRLIVTAGTLLRWR